MFPPPPFASISLPVDSTWTVAIGGYKVTPESRIVPMNKLKGTVAKPGTKAYRRDALRSYLPFAEEGLFLDFAALPRTDAGAIGFCDRYGDLWGDPLGHTVAEWLGAADELRAFVDDGPAGRRDWFGYTKRHEERAASVLQQVAVQLLPGPHVAIRPSNLLACLWLQACLAAVQRLDFVRCDYCGRHIRVTKFMKPGPRQYCREYCRIQSFRQRKAKGIALLKKGKSIEDVAEAVGSTHETVSGWAATAKPRKNKPTSKKESGDDS